ncbi:AMP-binding protein [Peribacillus asahii]|uniref:AMP-binding protein n=1 Tax=Peribacillus asahii TaxID=228899 RepID=UPI00207ACF01|nr:AMP-binding protein [Peribacillus asahii]USK72486.1 AMP-binding protein [Peribacillus asahii]
MKGELYKEYPQHDYWTDETLGTYFTKAINLYPNKTAVIDPFKRMTYRELGEIVTNIINGLEAIGIHAQDAVAYQLPNWVEGHALHNSLRIMGAVTVPVVPIYREKELKFILQETKAKAIVIPANFRNHDYILTLQNIKSELPELEHIIVIGETAPEGMITFQQLVQMGQNSVNKKDVSQFTVDPNDVCLIIYTSGTTSYPKGVQHTNNTLLREYKMFKENFMLSSETVIFMPSPITHISGLASLELPITLGARVTYIDIWDAEKAAEMISRERCNFMVSATPFLQWLVESDVSDRYDLTCMKNFICGGAYISPELIKKAPKAGIRAVRTYGSSECPTISLGSPNDPPEVTANTDGKIVSGYDVKIIGLNGEEVPLGQEGEIAIKGPEVFIGYKNSQLNADSFDEYGYFYSGDLGRLDAEGYLTITGRKKDVIIRGGENIATKELEDLLFAHPSIEQVAVVAMPDPVLGEKACAYVKVVPNLEFSFDEMIEYLLNKQIAKQKLPERLELIDEFPLTETGKILKLELRKMIANKLGLDPVRV